jgi:hypothetical protein
MVSPSSVTVSSVKPDFISGNFCIVYPTLATVYGCEAPAALSAHVQRFGSP